MAPKMIFEFILNVFYMSEKLWINKNLWQLETLAFQKFVLCFPAFLY